MELLEKLTAVAITFSLMHAFDAYKDIQAQKRFTKAIENVRLVDINKDGKLDIYFPQYKKFYMNTPSGFVSSTNDYIIGKK